MPLAGVEPVLGKPNSDLNAARLPIPPQWHRSKAYCISIHDFVWNARTNFSFVFNGQKRKECFKKQFPVNIIGSLGGVYDIIKP